MNKSAAEANSAAGTAAGVEFIAENGRWGRRGVRKAGKWRGYSEPSQP
jgi:hypothetical protein